MSTPLSLSYSAPNKSLHRVVGTLQIFVGWLNTTMSMRDIILILVIIIPVMQHCLYLQTLEKNLVLEDNYDPAQLGGSYMLLEQNWVRVDPFPSGKCQLLLVSPVWDHSESPVWGGIWPSFPHPLDLIWHWLSCWYCPSGSSCVKSLATLDPFTVAFPHATPGISS